MKTLVVDAELAQTEDAYTAATGGAPGKYTREMSMKKAPAPQATIACGECYSYAYARVREGGMLVHATVRDPWSGKRYGHAWVEDDGYVYDWQTSVGLGTGKPRTYAAFYDLYQPEQLRFFDTTAAAVNALRHRHYGPW